MRAALTPIHRLAWTLDSTYDLHAEAIKVTCDSALDVPLRPAPFEGGIAFRDAVPSLCADDLTWHQEALRLFQEADDHERERRKIPRPKPGVPDGLAYLIMSHGICFPRQGVVLGFGELDVRLTYYQDTTMAAFGNPSPADLRRARRRLLPILAPAFERSTPDWALASVGDLWLADASSLVAERALLVRDRFFLRSVDGSPLGEDPRVGDVVLLHGRRREVVSGAEHATHSYRGEDGRR